jgi:protocatechuate 3,4-dioxygenase beta subunit
MSETTKNVMPADHLAQVLGHIDQTGNPRVAEIAMSAIRHLHAFAEEVQLTREEWFESIEFLTRAGQMCDDKRQEFILLSDTIGLSMLVEMINHKGQDGTTEPTVFGPFHVDGAPHRQMGDSIIEKEVGGGERLVISGVVRSLDGAPIGGAELDIWQTAPNARYDVQDDGQPMMNYRGIFTTGADGLFEFETSRPVVYQIPDDGPAGDMLRATGRHNWRPGHVHFVVSAKGYKTVITHIFDSESDYLDSDAVFGVRDSLITQMSGGRADFEFVLESGD